MCTVLSERTVLKKLQTLKVHVMIIKYTIKSVMLYAKDARPSACWNTFAILCAIVGMSLVCHVMLIAHYILREITHINVNCMTQLFFTLLHNSTNEKTLLHVFTGVSVGQQQCSAVIGGFYLVSAVKCGRVFMRERIHLFRTHGTTRAQRINTSSVFQFIHDTVRFFCRSRVSAFIIRSHVRTTNTHVPFATRFISRVD